MHVTIVVTLLLVQIPVISLAQDEDKSLPHVSECNFCYDCVVTPTPPSALHHQHYSTGTGSRRSYRRLQRGQQTQQQLQQQRHAHRFGRHRLLTGTGGTGSINLQFSRSHGADALSSSSSSSSGLGPAFEWDGLSVGKRGARRTWEAMRGPSLIKYAASAVAAGIAGLVSDPNRVLPELLEPGDAINKIFKPNCTRCRGCTAQLYDMQTAEPAEGEGAGTGSNFPQFQHSVGTTPTWQFFARVPMSASRLVIKVFCMPIDKFTEKAVGRCDSAKYAERVRLVMAQARLADECGAGDITPRSWLAPIDAVVPAGPFRGFHIRWWVLWMEEARGTTLDALPREGTGANGTAELLSKRVDGQQLVLASVFDLLTGQCDRHSENVFVTAEGRLTLIDNDRALGVVERCRSNSMLLPTNTHHTALRVGFWEPPYVEYYKRQGQLRGFCTGPIDPRVALDYRCHVPGGVLGTSYPAPLRTCLEGLAVSAPAATAQRYGLPLPPAQLLQRRAADLLAMGFERAVTGAAPEPAPCYVYAPQPPCCDLSYDVAEGHVRCGTCWRPVPEERKA